MINLKTLLWQILVLAAFVLPLSCIDLNGGRQAGNAQSEEDSMGVMSEVNSSNGMDAILKQGGESATTLKIVTQTVGILSTNCYLIYDDSTKAAALIDPGDVTGNIIDQIEEVKLDLLYIFFTHCHPDHMYGMIAMDLDKKFPSAKICFTREEFDDMFNVVAQWEQSYPEYLVSAILNSPPYLRIFDMDYNRIGEPDIYVTDGQMFKLGDHQIQVIEIPGHARGSIGLYVDNVLFSGDELQYRVVGSTGNSPVASFEDQISSIRRLYTTCPDNTIVYPGHGRSTTIGDEKQLNSNITMDKASAR